jgi:hypothetical protein
MKILTSVVNNPTFIEMQYETLKKHAKMEYEFIVFNDSKPFPDFTNGDDPCIHPQIQNICNALNIKCINVPNESHKTNHCPVVRCSEAMNFMLEYMKQNIDEYLIIDSDMFLIDTLNIEEYRKFDCAIVIQSRDRIKHIDYFWNGLFYFNMNKMKNIELLNWTKVLDCDVGGMMGHWLSLQSKNIPHVNNIRHSNKNIFNRDGIYFIKHLWSITWNESEIPENIKTNKELVEFFESDPRNKNGNYYCEIYDDKFLHYRAGGNWNREGLDLHNYLTYKLKCAILK